MKTFFLLRKGPLHVFSWQQVLLLISRKMHVRCSRKYTESVFMSFIGLQVSEVSAVRYIPWQEYKTKLAEEHSDYVSYDISGEYGKLFSMIERRYTLCFGAAY